MRCTRAGVLLTWHAGMIGRTWAKPPATPPFVRSEELANWQASAWHTTLQARPHPKRPRLAGCSAARWVRLDVDNAPGLPLRRHLCAATPMVEPC